ncbi:MAG: hypothetical protein ACLP2Y_14280 [Limisphaerales bacterium]
MKLAYLVLAAAINPVFAGDLTQTNQLKPFDLWSVPPAASTPHQGPLLSGDFGLNQNWAPLNSTNLPVPNLKADKAPLDEKPLPQDQLKPGVYKTSPYTLLVLVPGPQSDDRSVHEAGGAGVDGMPTIKPDLKFIPYPAAEK